MTSLASELLIGSKTVINVFLYTLRDTAKRGPIPKTAGHARVHEATMAVVAPANASLSYITTTQQLPRMVLLVGKI